MSLGAKVPTCTDCSRRFDCIIDIDIGDFFHTHIHGDFSDPKEYPKCRTTFTSFNITKELINFSAVTKSFKEELIAAGIEGAEGLTAE